MEKLNEQSIAQQLSDLPKWHHQESSLLRQYEFPSFPGSISFVNRVANAAESMNHYPIIHVEHTKVTIRLTSVAAGGLTSSDFDLAVVCDGVYVQMSEEGALEGRKTLER